MCLYVLKIFYVDVYISLLFFLFYRLSFGTMEIRNAEDNDDVCKNKPQIIRNLRFFKYIYIYYYINTSPVYF